MYITHPHCSYSMIGNVLSHQFLEDQRVFCWRTRNECWAFPFVFTKQTCTDRKRFIGFEFMEPAELNKALRGSSGSLAGAKPRAQIETTLIAHSTPTRTTPGLRDSCNFRGPHRRFRCQKECELICCSKPTENSIIGSVLQ